MTSEPQTKEELKDYLHRLVRLIPSEVVGLYLVGQGVISEKQPGPILIWVLSLPYRRILCACLRVK
jgi:hypothetical protein